MSSLLVSLGVFASGYLMRPLGSVLFGRLADRRSRSDALRLSLLTIAVPTVLMGLLPNHSQIGPLAPVLLVLLRLIQGLLGSWASFGGIAGFTLGTAVAPLPPEALQSWGWRLPFLAAGVLGWRLRRQWSRRRWLLPARHLPGERARHADAPADGGGAPHFQPGAYVSVCCPGFW